MQTYAPRDPLREALRGDLTVRQLRVMIEHLPPGSAVHRALGGSWGDTEHLLHDIDSLVREVYRVVHDVAAARAKQPPVENLNHLPKPEPTPWQKERAGEQPDEIKAEADDLARVLALTSGAG